MTKFEVTYQSLSGQPKDWRVPLAFREYYENVVSCRKRDTIVLEDLPISPYRRWPMYSCVSSTWEPRHINPTLPMEVGRSNDPNVFAKMALPAFLGCIWTLC